MNNLQSLFPLGLLPDHAVIFPQLLQFCHIHALTMARAGYFSIPFPLTQQQDPANTADTIQLQKGTCMYVLGVGEGAGREIGEGDCGEKGVRRFLCS